MPSPAPPTDSSAATATDVLAFWHAVELLSPQAVPRPDPADSLEPVFQALKGQPLPWEPDHPLHRRPPPHCVRVFTVYCDDVLALSDAVIFVSSQKATPLVEDPPQG